MHIAVDLGAGSGRVFLIAFDANELVLEELHRFVYPPRLLGGCLRWDLDAIFEGVYSGLDRAAKRARELRCPIESLGIDSWAVDYGWLDAAGKIMAEPVCYRDDRTEGVPERVFQRISREQIFERTGIQIQRFNTLYQLCSEAPGPRQDQLFLLMPDLIANRLTGAAYAEYTNATTTQMVDIRSRNWDDELLEIAGVPRGSAPVIVPPGTVLGRLRSDGQMDAGLAEVVVIAPATHDTASAVAAAPLDAETAYISSGTWSLVGIEIKEPIISGEAADENFTNEGGVGGTFRFLKNVMGLWIFECCRREWELAGVDVRYDSLLRGLDSTGFSEILVFPDDERFLNPSSMLDAIAAQLSEIGHSMPEEPSMICKLIFDSLALRYASALTSIERIAQVAISAVEILGGGGRNRYLSQMTANACGRPVTAGLVEATVIGNAMVQAISLGHFSDLREARGYVADHHERQVFRPAPVDKIAHVFDRYLELENHFSRKAQAV